MKNMEEFIVNNFWLILILVFWSLVWKGLALWKAARRKKKWWFIVLLIIQSLGLLEISYIFVFTRKKQENENNQGESFS